jgi:hypothetical protein
MDSVQPCPLRTPYFHPNNYAEENALLKKEIYLLKFELRRIKSETSELLAHNYKYREYMIKYHLQLSEQPINYAITELPKTYFITITYDPDHTGFWNDENHEKVYILWHLWQCIELGHLLDFYGCFEKQSNGRIHSHLIAKSYNPKDCEDYLIKQFTTKNKKQQRAVQMDPAKVPNSIDYIEKTLSTKKNLEELKFGFFKYYKDYNPPASRSESFFQEGEPVGDALISERKVCCENAQSCYNIPKLKPTKSYIKYI